MTRILMRLIAFSVLAVTLGMGLASADDRTERTGKKCKAFLKNAVLDTGTSDLLKKYSFHPSGYDEQQIAAYGKSALNARLMDFDYKDGMKRVARGYVAGVKQIVNECSNYCTGLVNTEGRIFTCNGLKRSSPKQVSNLLESDLLMDSAVYYAEPLDDEALDKLFVDVDQSTVATDKSEQKENTNEKVSTHIGSGYHRTSTYPNIYIRKIGEHPGRAAATP